MEPQLQNFYYMGVALSVGLLIGIERGWKVREADEGERIAGVRTYGLIGLLGGTTGLISSNLGALTMGLAFVAMAGILTTVYVVNLRTGEDVGITSLVTGILTFSFGALAAMGYVEVVAASAVVTVMLLSYKPLLHHWLSELQGNELRAGIKLLLISVVLLPILPNQGYGPWQVLNPYTIWWLVVLIAMISFVGYFAIKIGGARKGAVFTGIFGGLAGSTAVTLHFSRLTREDPQMGPMLATGILLACATMFPRMLLVASLLNTDLFVPLLLPAVVMALLVYLPAFWLWWSQSHQQADTSSPLNNPLELKAALSFGALLTLVIFLGKALQSWFGDAGVLVLSAASGVADVDAITLSLAKMTQDDLALRVAVMGIIIAAAVNTLVKGGMAAIIGGRVIALRVGLPLLASVAFGLITAWLWVW